MHINSQLQIVHRACKSVEKGEGRKRTRGGESELSGWRTRLRWLVIKCSQVTVASPTVITSPSRERRSSLASPWQGTPRRRCLAMETRNEFLYGTLLPSSSSSSSPLPPPSSPLPPPFSLLFLYPSSVLSAHFIAIPIVHVTPRRSCRVLLFHARFGAGLSWPPLPLDSRRASFNEKLISRVRVVDCA